MSKQAKQEPTFTKGVRRHNRKLEAILKKREQVALLRDKLSDLQYTINEVK